MTNTRENWKRKFENLFEKTHPFNDPDDGEDNKGLCDSYKLFIRTLLSEERSRVLEEAIKCVPEEKDNSHYRDDYNFGLLDGHNRCRETTIDALNSLKGN